MSGCVVMPLGTTILAILLISAVVIGMHYPAKPKPHGTEHTAAVSENSGFEQTDSEKLY